MKHWHLFSFFGFVALAPFLPGIGCTSLSSSSTALEELAVDGIPALVMVRVPQRFEEVVELRHLSRRNLHKRAGRQRLAGQHDGKDGTENRG